MLFSEILGKTGVEIADFFNVREVYLFAHYSSGGDISVSLTPSRHGSNGNTLCAKLNGFAAPRSWCLKTTTPRLERITPQTIILAVVDGEYIPPGEFAVGHAMKILDPENKVYSKQDLERVVRCYNSLPTKLND